MQGVIFSYYYNKATPKCLLRCFSIFLLSAFLKSLHFSFIFSKHTHTPHKVGLFTLIENLFPLLYFIVSACPAFLGSPVLRNPHSTYTLGPIAFSSQVSLAGFAQLSLLFKISPHLDYHCIKNYIFKILSVLQ